MGALRFMKGRHLTVKLRGRPPRPDKRRGRTLSLSARGAKQSTHHGPLQRLLEAAVKQTHDIKCLATAANEEFASILDKSLKEHSSQTSRQR